MKPTMTGKITVRGIRIFLALSLLMTPMPSLGEAGSTAPSQGIVPQANIPDVAIPETQKQAIRANFSKVKVPWIENQGQVDKQVAFYAKLSNGTVYLTKEGEMVHQYLFSKPDEASIERTGLGPQLVRDGSPEREPSLRGIKSQQADQQVVVFKKRLKNSQKLYFQGETPSITSVNYFTGNNPKDWKTNLNTYESVGAREIYPNIDLSYQPKMGSVEEIFTINPGGKPEDVEVEIEGVKGISVDEAGDLVIATITGDFKQTKPIAYQMIEGKRIDRTAHFKVIKNGSLEREPFLSSYGFQVADYDPRYSLIIDPLIYSTFVGDASGSRAASIVLDSQNNVYVTGDCGTGFPTTTGAYRTVAMSIGDGFVFKLSSDGRSLLYSTFFGGKDHEFPSSIALDIQNNALVTGTTLSTDFPTTTGAHDRSFSGQSDIFVIKLSAAGSSLLYSTFVGGNQQDGSSTMALDSQGNAYVTGVTYSTDFPTTTNAYDRTFNGAFGMDAFVFKLSADGKSLIYSTFVGGTGLGNESGHTIVLDAQNNAYVDGETNSADFPTTAGAYDRTYNAGPQWEADVFVLKLSADGASLLYSTFVGGSGADYGGGIALDSQNNAFVSGFTSSANFPTTAGAYDTTFNGGLFDVFAFKLSANGASLLYSTFVGGMDNDFGSGVQLDSKSNAYVCSGSTRSNNFPTTVGAYDTKHNGFDDAFVFKLSANCSSLVYSTYVGGANWDGGGACVLDAQSNVYVAGRSNSVDFPTTANAYDQVYYGGDREVAVVFKLDLGSFIDIGLRIFDGATTVRIATEPDTAVTSPLRIAKGGKVYGIKLVEPGDAKATKIRVKTNSGVKAIAKLD